MSEERRLREDSEALIVPVVGFVGPALMLYFAGFQAFVYESYAAATLLTVLGGASAFTPRIRRSGGSSIRYLSGLLVIGVFGTAFLRGGVVLGVLGWLLFPPLVSVLAFRFKEAAVWLAVSISAVLVLMGLEEVGLTPPRRESTQTGMLGGTIAAVVGLSGVVFAQAWSRQAERRQREHMEKRLFRANKLESIARLAGGVAHDFSNLLTVITNHAQILADEELSPNKDIQAIQHAAGAGTALTRRLLAIGRERDETKEHQAIDLNGVGAKVSSLLQTLMPAGVRLNFDAAPGPAVARVDPWDIHQVLMNLVINARDAMPDGGEISLSITLESPTAPVPLRFGILDPGPYVALRVADGGVGMSDALMNKIVEPFFTTRGRRGGTGLGLSIVYGVTRALGGQLNIESVVDEGTTFTIYFPYCDEIPMSTIDRDGTSSFPAASSHVLLVDDDPAVRRSISRLIGLEGHEVVTAEGPDAAREAFRAGNVNVLVTDISMPDGSGEDLAQELLEHRPDLGVVFVSGREPDHALQGPNVRYLTKPASRKELRKAVRAVSRRAPVRRAQTTGSNPPVR